MKADVSIDRDNWVNITLEAENVSEAAKLVKLGMNQGKNGASVYVGEDAVRLYVSVMPTPSRRQAQNQKSYVQFHK